MNEDQTALMFHSDEAALHAAEIAGVEVVLIDKEFSRKTRIYGFDPYTYQNDVMPLVAAIVLPTERLEQLRDEGEALGEVWRTTPDDVEGWVRGQEPGR